MPNTNLLITQNSGNIAITPSDAITRFNEQLTASAKSIMNFKPTWGVSTLRYTVVNSGTGAGVATEAGEFRLQTGTDINGSTWVRTNQRGQYVANSTGRFGIGVRMPVMPTGTQVAEWGYYDFLNNGYFQGADVSGLYAAYLTGGVKTKYYQADWNIDKLDGTGPSGLTLDLADGVICQIDFSWYGDGDIEFSYYPYNPATLKIEKVVVHRLKVQGAISTIDANQPIAFMVSNGASSSTNFNLYIGGQQFSILTGESEPQQRPVTQLITNYITAANTNWQPLIAVRKKPLFSGMENSIKMGFSSLELSADGECEVRVTIGGTTSNLSWVDPTGWPSTETAAEVKVSGGTALATSVEGVPIFYGFVNASGGRAAATVSKSLELPLGQTTEVVLWIRRLSASGTVHVRHAHITWNEDW